MQTLLDKAIHRVHQSTPPPKKKIYSSSSTDISTFFPRPLADYSQRQSYNFGNFLRRLAFTSHTP